METAYIIIGLIAGAWVGWGVGGVMASEEAYERGRRHERYLYKLEQLEKEAK